MVELKFCTLFDSNYLSKGLCLYDSLFKVCPNFHLYIFAFDDECLKLLQQLKLKQVTVISLSQFEDIKLLEVKSTRTKAEYCWTSTPSTISYCLKNYNLDHCTYIDADLFFFSNPTVLIEEMGRNDVLITEHRYTSQYDQSALSGKYCVQFVTFKNNENGLKILTWWRNACLDWCYNRREDGKFGDQKYLDDWTTRFQGVHELIHLGGGVAPWNVQQYKIVKERVGLKGIEKSTNLSFELVFFHFHYLNVQQLMFLNEFYFGPYLLSKAVSKNIYKPYIEMLRSRAQAIKTINAQINASGANDVEISFLRLILHTIKNSFNKNKKIFLR